jgi:hypothetical protein
MARPSFALLSLALIGACRPVNPTVDDVRVQLWDQAREMLDERRAVLGDDARRALKDMAERGASRLAADGAPPDARHAAEDQMRRLAREVIAEANHGQHGDKGFMAANVLLAVFGFRALAVKAASRLAALQAPEVAGPVVAARLAEIQRLVREGKAEEAEKLVATTQREAVGIREAVAWLRQYGGRREGVVILYVGSAPA